MAVEGVDREQLDEAFLQALYEGSDLLGRGQLSEAREALERALEVRPDDPKARNLLGLTAFKLGEHNRALDIYAQLIAENPAEATLRVNLGLVHLKLGRFEDAIRELSTAVDLAPEHRRAHNYLGLAYARVGDYAQARECFALAGSEQMVERMERVLAGERSTSESSGTAAAEGDEEAATDETMGADEELAADAPPAEQPIDLGESEPAPGEAPPPGSAAYTAPPLEAYGGESAAEVTSAETAPERTVPAAVPPAAPQEEAGAPAPEAAAVPARLPAAAAPRWRVPRDLLDLAEDLEVEAPEAAAFAVAADVAVARVEEPGLLARLRHLLFLEGELELTPEVKRFRGKTTDRPFGEGEERVYRLEGRGRVVLARGRHALTPLELEGADGYFQEHTVAAFEGGVTYENGRVPSDLSPDLHLVHLKGAGAVLLETDGPVRSVHVDAAHPVRVPLGRLVGWHGQLTPRLRGLIQAEQPRGGVAVELVGEGVVLMALPEPARPPRP